jgi:hypothetical protein
VSYLLAQTLLDDSHLRSSNYSCHEAVDKMKASATSCLWKAILLASSIEASALLKKSLCKLGTTPEAAMGARGAIRESEADVPPFACKCWRNNGEKPTPSKV